MSDHSAAQRIIDEVSRAVVGNKHALQLILAAIMANGHILIEDLPGLGKTLIARSFAQALGLDFSRIQFTPDLLPADILGATVYDLPSGRFEYRPGPIFANVVLADELNRTPPKTQAALLEAMAERQVTVDGETHCLPHPFVVMATENPIEHEGTYPLPEAQLDRFMIRTRLGYLSPTDERALLARRLSRQSAEAALTSVLTAREVTDLQDSVESVAVHPDLLGYVVSVLTATRDDPRVEIGASPRAGLDLVQLARATARLSGRDFVIAEDIKPLAVPTLAHRISLKPEMWVRQVRAEDVIADIVGRTPLPRITTGEDVSGDP